MNKKPRMIDLLMKEVEKKIDELINQEIEFISISQFELIEHNRNSGITE